MAQAQIDQMSVVDEKARKIVKPKRTKPKEVGILEAEGQKALEAKIQKAAENGSQLEADPDTGVIQLDVEGIVAVLLKSGTFQLVTDFKSNPINCVQPWVQRRFIEWRESNRIWNGTTPAVDENGKPLYDITRERVYHNPEYDSQQFVSYGLCEKKRREKKEKTPEEIEQQKVKGKLRHKDYYQTNTKPKMTLMKEIAAEIEAQRKRIAVSQDVAKEDEIVVNIPTAEEVGEAPDELAQLRPMTPLMVDLTGVSVAEPRTPIYDPAQSVQSSDQEMLKMLGLPEHTPVVHLPVTDEQQTEVPRKKKRSSRRKN
jgi:hypothetical protein